MRKLMMTALVLGVCQVAPAATLKCFYYLTGSTNGDQLAEYRLEDKGDGTHDLVHQTFRTAEKDAQEKYFYLKGGSQPRTIVSGLRCTFGPQTKRLAQCWTNGETIGSRYVKTTKVVETTFGFLSGHGNVESQDEQLKLVWGTSHQKDARTVSLPWSYCTTKARYEVGGTTGQ